MLSINKLTLGNLATNCYLVFEPQSGETVIIDPADAGDFISQTIIERELTPVGIVLTHGHFDHVLGLLEVSLNFSVPIWLHPADIFLVQNAQNSSMHWLKQSVDPVPLPTHQLKTDTRLTLGHGTHSEYLTILETPGHTPGSVTLLHHQAIFTGDTLFKQGVGRTDFSYSDSQALVKSIQKINHTAQQLDANLVVYPGHGDSATMADISRLANLSE